MACVVFLIKLNISTSWFLVARNCCVWIPVKELRLSIWCFYKHAYFDDVEDDNVWLYILPALLNLSRPVYQFVFLATLELKIKLHPSTFFNMFFRKFFTGNYFFKWHFMSTTYIHSHAIIGWLVKSRWSWTVWTIIQYVLITTLVSGYYYYYYDIELICSIWHK